jgi:hypothetical protein
LFRFRIDVMDSANADSPLPVWFTASFPRQPGLVPAVSELAVRIAGISGYADEEARGIGREVDLAIERALADSAVPDGSFDVSFQADGRTFEVIVSCRGQSLLTLVRPRPA